MEDMAVLFCSLEEEPERWRGPLLAADPGLDFRVWPATGPVEDIEFALVWKHPPGELRRYPNLKVIFQLGAGVDNLLRDPGLPPGVPIVRLVDHGLTIGMSEYVLLHVLRYHRRMPELEEQQRRRQWVQIQYPLPWERSIGIMGLGVIGGDAAARLKALEFQLRGWSRSPKQIAGVACFHGEAGLVPFLSATEILVCLLPLTPATAGIIDARTLAALPKGACVINAARGAHVVADDLLAALESGHIAHATLDVFTPEPLPREHPFWTHPRVTVTPHVAGITQPQTSAAGIIDGMRRARAGLPLANRVDPVAGY